MDFKLLYLNLRYKLSILTRRKASYHFINLLRYKGVRIGEHVNFRSPATDCIDVTRPYMIEIGNNVDLNIKLTILTHDFGTYIFRNLYKDFVNSSGKVKIGNNVVIGQNVTILKNVTIGDNCLIGAGSIVSKSIPSNSVAVGSPARVICSIEEYYRKRKEKSIQEAIDLGIEIYKLKGENLQISDFREEWCQFMSKEDYDSDEKLREQVDFRMKQNLGDFFNRERPFKNYNEFLSRIKSEM